MEDQYYDIQRRTEIKDTARELRRKHLRYKDAELVGLEQPDIRAPEIHGTDRPIRLTAEAGVFPMEEELAALDVPFDKAVEDSASSKPQKDEKTKPSSIKDKLAKGESKKTEATKAKAEITKECASKTKEAVIA